MMLKNLKVLALVTVIALSGCSLLHIKKEGTPEAKLTVARVADKYLVSIITGNTKEANKMIDWTVFLEDKANNTAISDINQQMLSLKQLYSPEDHPLTNLALLDVEVWDSDGEVILRKKGDSDHPTIEIQLHWYGSGWLITKDNLFGEDGIVTEALAAKK